jgi:aerobic C4-dicarboxylate transport protein
MDAATPAAPPGRAPAAHHPWYTVLYIQVLIAIALGILLGHFFPKIAIPMKPLGDGFIARR